MHIGPWPNKDPMRRGPVLRFRISSTSQGDIDKPSIHSRQITLALSGGKLLTVNPEVSVLEGTAQLSRQL